MYSEKLHTASPFILRREYDCVSFYLSAKRTMTTVKPLPASKDFSPQPHKNLITDFMYRKYFSVLYGKN